ncbi:unnamed protein product [Closterium sp. NIES-65]|nr:unnamed protein product [Closterium sp. NIES-65]CAI5998727.1 unnamed protein product [Closterium sp. NIES-65]
MSGASAAPAADADNTIRSQWTTRNAATRLAVRSHLPSTERAHFSQYKSAKTLYDVVVARYSSPASAALSRLMVPYLFPDLAAFPTVADLITHLRTSDTCYRAALPAEFCAKNPPPSEKSIVAVGASRGYPRAPLFEGCSPVPLLPSVASATAVDLVGTESVGDASAPSGRRRSGKGKGAGGAGGGGGGGGGGGEGARLIAYVLRAGNRTGEPCGSPHATQRCFGRLTDAWRLQFPDATEIPRWGELLRSGAAIFDIDYDAILAAMYVVSTSDEGDGYLCVPPDPGIEAAALGAGLYLPSFSTNLVSGADL